MGQEYSPVSKNREVPCSRCGVLIKQGDPIHIERHSQEETDHLYWLFSEVCHQHCWDQYLEDGESSE